MRFFDFYRRRASSAEQAKERLQGIVALERMQNSECRFLPLLQDEVLDVVRKFVDVDNDDVHVGLDRRKGGQVLSIDILLPRAGAAARDDITPNGLPSKHWATIYNEEAKEEMDTASS